MTYREHFPDFQPEDLPAMPEGFIDSSWHNDVSPSFENYDLLIRIWVDYKDPELRETGAEGTRFCLCRLYDDEGCHYMTDDPPLLETDDWDEVLAFVENERAAAAQSK